MTLEPPKDGEYSQQTWSRPLLTVYRLPKEAMDSPLQYSKSRDVHSVGVLFLQMLVGWNVMEIYPSPKLALQSRSFLH